MQPVASSTKQHLDDHLSQAEFALRVVANFDCLKGTPAHDTVRVALARVVEARSWTRDNVSVDMPIVGAPDLAYQGVAVRRRIVHRRMAKLAP